MARITQRVLRKVVQVSNAVATATNPVIALESTVITHGLPKPRNLECVLPLMLL